MTSGMIFDIRRYAIHDGPGIRTAVFFKGCPLACHWCHNPEGIAAAPQLIFRPARCILCDECLPVCPQAAITRLPQTIHIQRALCQVTGACALACPAEALEVVGRQMTSAQVMDEIERDRIFYQRTGGGATFTGGEPLSQAPFLLELLTACRQRAIHTVLDTSGYAPWPVIASLLPLVGLILYDLKIIDPLQHLNWVGVPNDDILSNLRQLASIADGPAILVRLPLIPGLTTTNENLHAIGQFLASLPHPPPVELLPYHANGLTKTAGLGQEPPTTGLRPPTPVEIQAHALLLAGHGLQVRC